MSTEEASALWDTARAAYPTLALDQATFCAALRAHLDAALARGESREAWRERLHAAELYLACAVCAGCAEALRVLLHEHGALLSSLAARYAPDADSAEDMRQALLQRLLVGDDRRPARLTMYAGQGALGAWLRVTATRAYLDMTRAEARRPELLVSGEHFDQVSDELRDLELDFLKQSYRVAFKAAFAEAVEALTPRQKNILAQHTLARLNINQLGAIYGIHRATAARWVEDARGALAVQTRAALQRRLELGDDELDSVMHLIQSQASLSLSRLLGGPAVSAAPEMTHKDTRC